MSTITIAAAQLQPGDEIVEAGITVAAVQHLGPLVIVDFTDDTASPPVPANGAVTVRRAS